MNLKDQIQSADYIYSTYTKWGLKKYLCDIEYFKEENLGDLYYVICSILESNDGIYDKRSLGILLGFAMANQSADRKNEVYYDVAEVKLFEDILAEVEREHLIKIVENDVLLTNLGQISLKENKHYTFYKGKQVIYEHLKLRSETPTALLMFPFYKDMGISTQITESIKFWPNDVDIENIIYYKKDQLLKRIENHSLEFANIFHAKQDEYFDIEIRKIHINLYKSVDSYLPIVMNDGSFAEKATKLILEPLNKDRQEDLILECLFQKLWDDKNAIFNYESLNPYFDLIDYEELTKDPRTIWEDCKLFKIIIERANQTCWRNITRFCSISVLYSHLNLIKENINWPIFTSRVDDDFLINNFLIYPWDLEILSEDNNRKEETLEKLILLQKDTEEDWNWEILEQRLASNFVLENLNLVKVNLSVYTEDNANVRNAILNNIECRWDWNKVESTFNLEFIYDNITELGNYFNFYSLFDRVFRDEFWTEKFIDNKNFKTVIKNASQNDGPLTSCILNDKDYYWKPSVIDFFSSLGLIGWSSTPYMKGFECNPSLVWNKEFFAKYSENITTEEGHKYISKSISDLEIIKENPSFDWSWDDVSSNLSLVSNYELFSHFGDKLNWKSVLVTQEDVSFIQGIEDIEAMIADDEEAWTLFSEIASLDYVKKQYRAKGFPWNWTVLTERMFEDLKLENIGHAMFVDKWDWDYLSTHIEKNFLLANLDKYSKYWNWDIVFDRILTSSNRVDYTFLDNIASILTNISGKERCQKAWSSLTKQYKFKELKRLIKETVHKRAYWWDISYFCQHEEFNVFTDLEDFHNIVDWEALSISKAVDNSLRFNPKLKLKPKAWTDDILKILSDSRNRWNFKALSSFESLRDQKWFLSRFKKVIDWEYISKNSKIFAENDKQKLNEIIEAYKDYINFKVLSERTDVNIEQIIKIYPKADYDYNLLLERGIIKVNMSVIDEMSDYEWNWHLLTSKESFVPKASWLEDKFEEDLNWEFLTSHENDNAWSNEGLLLKLAKDKNISNRVNWKFISEQKYFPLSKNLLMLLPFSEINWRALSNRKSIVNIIHDFREMLDWKILSASKHIDISDYKFLNEYKDQLVWNIVCNRDDFTFTNNILDTFHDYIDWDKASSSLDIKFSQELVEKHQERWNWPVLVKNRAFNNLVDVSGMPYVKQINIVDFINHFRPHKPQAFHFTHMSNALKIIQNMKLQSRNYAEGNFTNSAGSNVHRTSKAHRFARFYFMPKSPTQFYNECLGKDKGDKYYRKALNLGLPKCPLPVFFIFDIEELLMNMPDKCYYSTGNMQKDSAKSFKVIENPNRIKAREIYINSYDTFNERQQEFLIEGELDFSKLKKVQICCYDEYQTDMLRKELEGTQWEDIISTNRNLYEHCNKELKYIDTPDSIRIATNGYLNPYEFKVVYSDECVPNIINKNMVLRQRGNSIYMQDSVELTKEVPFEIYFETKDPRIESWLIYKNR